MSTPYVGGSIQLGTGIRYRIYGPIPDEMPPPPTHCTNCGRELIFVLEPSVGFLEDGRPAPPDPTWRCPKTVGRWNRWSLTFMTHDEYEPDKFIDWHWRKRWYR